MPLHTTAGFVADFPVKVDGGEPVGRELAQFVHEQLVKCGMTASPPEERGGWAWEMFTREGELQVETIVGLVDDMQATPPRQWLITNDCAIPFLRRIFGKKDSQAKRESLLRRLCESLHSAMSGDSRFSHLTWYDASTFDKPGDTPSDRP